MASDEKITPEQPYGWVRRNDGPWELVTRQEWINAERSAGFRSKFGPNEPATAGFGSDRDAAGNRIQGRLWLKDITPEDGE